ncbi:3775_t:CDS:2 [Funneliformis geosporum]|nr:3775_t:CDS:2 [Funneliformis geosporum]
MNYKKLDVEKVSSYAPSRHSFGDDDSPTYLAISPNGVCAATFNSDTYEIKIYHDKNNKLTFLKELTFPEKKKIVKSSSDKVSFSFAISDFANTEKHGFVAVSHFRPPDMKKKIKINKQNSVENPKTTIKVPEKGYPIDHIPVETFVLSTKTDSNLTAVYNHGGGVVRFLNEKNDDQSNGFTNLIVMNASGIAKVFIYHKYFNNRSINKSLVVNEYDFPTIIQDNLDKLYHDSPCTSFLNTIVERNFLFVEDYKNQILEMYNLQSMDLELTFQKHNPVILSTQEHGKAIYSVSKHGHLLAYCNGTKNITIYLMENGLEVTTKEFIDAIKILSISFIDDDERLFVVTENTTKEATEEAIDTGNEETSEEDSEKGTEETIEVNEEAIDETESFTATINIWDIFTFKNDLREFDDESNIFISLQKSYSHSIACSSGAILAYLQNGVISVLPYLTSKLKPTNISPTLELKNASKFIRKEPWVRYTKGGRTPSYLDKDEQIQLIIGETSVQVWKKKKGTDTKNKRVLKYIWMNLGKKLIIDESLKIGNCEFSLDLLCNDTSDEKNIVDEMKENIHWPNKAHVLKDACVAMEYLYERRYEPAGPNNLNKYHELFAGTEKLIKKCIKKNPNLWSCSEVRYGIMSNIIRSKHIPLLHWILFDYKEADGNKQDKTRVSRYMHIPCQYVWPMKKKKNDLMLAIKQSEDENRRDKSIVAMLLEYYSNNAEKNTGWMFTFTKSLPSLNQLNFEPYLKELFYKPCFGSKEEWVDSKFVSPSKLKKGYKSEICSLNVRPRLLLKQNDHSLWRIFKTKYLEGSKVSEGNASNADEISTSATDEKKTQVTVELNTPATDEENKQATVEINTPATDEENNTQATDEKGTDEKSIKDKKITRVTAVRVVPLPDFIVYPTHVTDVTDKTHDNWIILFKLIKLIFWPRRYLIHDKDHFSPFLELLSNSKNEHLYDNPAMEACIDFKWGAARNRFLRFFVMFIVFSFTFALITGLNKDSAFTKVLLALFFYIGIYLLATEFVQFKHEGLRYFSIYNILDVASIILALITMINYLSGFVVEIEKAIIMKAFAVLLLWLELLIATVAFGHAMHVILEHPDLIHLKPNGDKFSINSKNPDLEGLTMEQVIDIDDPMDNYYRKLTYSVIGAYFWILGRWDQLEKWDFWPIYVISIGASILIVIIMQNLLIAFMTGVYENARNNVKLAVLGYRADLVADYETLEKPLGSSRGNPRYIYYVGNAEYQENWLDRAEKHRKFHKSLLIEDINYQLLRDRNDEQHFKLQDEIRILQNDVKELLSFIKSK